MITNCVLTTGHRALATDNNMEKFFTAIQNMFKIPELRKRILFTLGLLAVYRFGAHVQAPVLIVDSSEGGG